MPPLSAEPNKLVPLRKFAKPGVYSSAYLSQLVQRKTPKAQKIGRNFYTTQEWFDEYLSLHARDCKQDGYTEKSIPVIIPVWKNLFFKHRASALVALVFVFLIGSVWFISNDHGKVAGENEVASSSPLIYR